MKTSNHIQLSINFNQLVSVIKNMPYQEQLKLAQIIDKETKKAHKKEAVTTHFASEAVLAKDWLSTEEDEAWKNL